MRPLALALVVLAIAAASVPAWFGWRRTVERQQTAMSMTGGDIHRAKPAMAAFGCAGCHRIPGMTGARGQVGPPLADIAGRIYIAGSVTNTPENLIHWIMDPL